MSSKQKKQAAKAESDVPAYTNDDLVRIAEELRNRRVTEWLDPREVIVKGDTNYNCRTNHGWLKMDCARLVEKGVKAAVIAFNGKEAVFRIDRGETIMEIVSKLELTKNINTSTNKENR